MAFMIVGLRKQATADAAVKTRDPPKYMYVALIRSFTYCGQTLN